MKSKYKLVKTVLWVILFANFAVATIKILIGTACNSQSAMADGIHSLADGASNIVGLIGVWLASKPKDNKHQYGHAKFEILASLGIGIMLAVMSVRIMSRAIMTFGNSSEIGINYIQGLLMVITIITNTAVAVTEFNIGKKVGSAILVTDSLHTRGDIAISCAVLIGLIAIKSGMPLWIDAVLSIAVAIVVLISAFKIIKNCVDVLVDSTVIDSEEIKNLLLPVSGVLNIHKVRSRGEPTNLFIDLHVIVDPNSNAVSIHILSHRLESILKNRFGDDTEVNIHLEPDDGLHKK